MGDRHHLHSHGRTLVVLVHHAGIVLRPRRGLVDEPPSGPAVGGPSGADGLVATTRAHPGHSVLTSQVSIYFAGVSKVSGGASRDLQHEFGGQLCRERSGRELL